MSRTFAKAWGLAGLRIGYGIANTDMIKYEQVDLYEVNTIAAHLIQNSN